MSLPVPDNFKIRIEKENSFELGKMYDFLFDKLGCSWAGRVGHYAYGLEHQKAKNQDGFIYGIRKLDGWRAITADPFFAEPNSIEITWRDKMFKFEIDQLVFYMGDNKVCSAPILSRMCVENNPELNPANTEQETMYRPFGETRIRYKTIHGVYKEDVLFATKEELLASL